MSSMSEITASVLAVGSEITSGQIINKNASWISQQLRTAGLATTWHLTVPDEKSLILKALATAAYDSQWVFITGGLGPTSDDFTRDIVCEWAGVSTFFHEPSWRHVQERLTSRGLEVHEFQKQQCYFPVGADVLTNTNGTANGFKLEANGKTLFCLPGPPREIENIWNAHIAPWVKEKTAEIDAWETVSWDLLGLGESQVAALALPAVDHTKYDIGYRVHMPYVEFKLSYRRSQKNEIQSTIEALEKVFDSWIALRNGEDMVERWCRLLPEGCSWLLQDSVSDGYLLHRLQSALPKLFKTTRPVLSRTDTVVTTEFSFQLLPVDEMTAKAVFKYRSRTAEEIIPAHNASSLMKERRQQFFAEKALIFWTGQMRN